jgi:hypothetical protein
MFMANHAEFDNPFNQFTGLYGLFQSRLAVAVQRR